MCGIIGIIGKAPVTPLLVDALKRLEYRGYDSAGIATLVNGHIDRRRAEGKLVNLEARLKDEPLTGTIGIGHTRWATHGKPSERNAHPIATDRVAVVHNGIIENFQELKEEMEAEGRRFDSDTDTEVVAQLVTSYLEQQMSPEQAMGTAMARLRGAFALVVLFSGRHDLLMGARRGSSLAVGYGDGEMYIGTDALALAPFTKRVSYLEDEDWVVLTQDGAKIYQGTTEVKREVRQTGLSGAMMGKGNHRHFMLKEIHEQPAVIGDTLQSYVDPATRTVALPALPFDWNKVSRITLTGCGGAFYVCMVAKYWFEQIARLPVEVELGSEFRYRAPPLPEGGVCIAVSQSGETADTLAAVRYAKAEKQTILSVVNVPESAIARESDVVLHTLAGPEISVCSTKATTTQQTVLLAAAIAAGPGARHAVGGRRGALRGGADRAAGADQRGAEHGGAVPADRRHRARRGARRALSRPRHVIPGRARGGPEAEGDLLHPCRGLRGGGDEARADRADRRAGAGRGRRAQRFAVRQDGVELRAGQGARRQAGAAEQRRRRGAPGAARGRHAHPARGRSGRGPDPLHDPGAAAGLLHGHRQGHRCRPAAQSRQERHRRVVPRTSTTFSGHLSKHLDSGADAYQ